MNEEYDECVFMCDGFLLHKNKTKKRRKQEKKKEREKYSGFLLWAINSLFLYFFFSSLYVTRM